MVRKKKVTKTNVKKRCNYQYGKRKPLKKSWLGGKKKKKSEGGCGESTPKSSR